MHALGQNGWHCRLCGQPLATESPQRPESDVVFAVVIPVHNESDQIAQNLSLIHSEASKTGLPMEMIVVDDGSTDSTWQALEKLAEQMPELKALRFSRNFGKEGAICAGLAYSSGQACIVMDSDLQLFSGYALILYFTGLALPGLTSVIVLELLIGGC